MTEGDRSTSSEGAPQPNRDADDGVDPEAAVDRSSPPGSRARARPEANAATDAAGWLAVVCGLPGVGKTTVAKRVAGHVDGEILRTDVIRKELFDDPEYSEAETEAVYAELIRRARDRVASGSSVVLDATFADARFRDDVREVGDRVADEFDLLEVECDETVVERRIERRDGISDADFEIHLHFKELFDRIESEHVVVDNSGTEAETFAQVDAAFAADEDEDEVAATSEVLTAADGESD